MTILDRADHLPSGRLVKSPTWLAVVSFTAFLAVLIIPNDFEYPAILTGLLVYPAMQWACRDCRFDLARPINPLNWALFLFFLQVVILPLLITFFGPAQGVLPFLASGFSINTSVLLINLSYIAFCMGYQYSASRVHEQAAGKTVTWVDPTKSMLYILMNFALGFIGLFCTFRSIGGLVRYFTEPDEYKLAIADTTVTMVEAAGSFLKPFLGFSFIMLWCNWADRWGRVGSSARRLAITAVMILPALMSFATFNYNRGSFVAPLVSITAVYLAKVQRVSLVALAGFGSAALGFLILIGLYRAGGMGMNELAGNASSREALTQKLNLVEELQVYGQAPQFLGFILERSDYGRHLYFGYTLISSVMLPVPVLGETFRPTSGVMLYNEMIYGHNSFRDQIIPFQGELFLNFHFPGIAAGYWLLGLATAGLERTFKKVTKSLDIYITLYVSYWILFMIQSNPAIVSQIFVYFLWPVYFYLVSRYLLTRLRRA